MKYLKFKDEKMLKALEIDYENNKAKVDLTKLYPNTPSAHSPLNKGVADRRPDRVFADTPLKEGDSPSVKGCQASLTG